MKRLSTTALILLGLMLALGACTPKTTPSTTAVEQSSSSDAAMTDPAVAPAAAAASVDATAPTEQVTETGGSEAIGDAAAQPLALRINEVKPPPASKWIEGTNYVRLIPAQPTTALPGQIEVTEVFWYGCSHCYALDPLLESWRSKGRPGYVSFVRVPVMWGAVHKLHARLYHTAEMLGKLPELHAAIFQAIQRNRQPLDSAGSIEAFFTSHGVSQSEFQNAFSSFAVDASLKRAETLGLRYNVDSVPLIVINGKYVTDVGRAGGQQQLIALINDLASREHAN